MTTKDGFFTNLQVYNKEQLFGNIGTTNRASSTLTEQSQPRLIHFKVI